MFFKSPSGMASLFSFLISCSLLVALSESERCSNCCRKRSVADEYDVDCGQINNGRICADPTYSGKYCIWNCNKNITLNDSYYNIDYIATINVNNYNMNEKYHSSQSLKSEALDQKIQIIDECSGVIYEISSNNNHDHIDDEFKFGSSRRKLLNYDECAEFYNKAGKLSPKAPSPKPAAPTTKAERKSRRTAYAAMGFEFCGNGRPGKGRVLYGVKRRILFHATNQGAAEAMKEQCDTKVSDNKPTQGIMRLTSSSNTGWYGRGIYFAASQSSALGKGQRGTPTHIVLASVATGNEFTPEARCREADIQDPECYIISLRIGGYDSYHVTADIIDNTYQRPMDPQPTPTDKDYLPGGKWYYALKTPPTVKEPNPAAAGDEFIVYQQDQVIIERIYEVGKWDEPLFELDMDRSDPPDIQRPPEETTVVVHSVKQMTLSICTTNPKDTDIDVDDDAYKILQSEWETEVQKIGKLDAFCGATDDSQKCTPRIKQNVNIYPSIKYYDYSYIVQQQMYYITIGVLMFCTVICIVCGFFYGCIGGIIFGKTYDHHINSKEKIELEP